MLGPTSVGIIHFLFESLSTNSFKSFLSGSSRYFLYGLIFFFSFWTVHFCLFGPFFLIALYFVLDSSFFYLGQNSLCGLISFLLFGTFIVLLPFSLYIYILFFLLHFLCDYGPTFVLCVGCFLFGPFSFYRPVIFVWAIICFRLACLDSFFLTCPFYIGLHFLKWARFAWNLFFQFSFGLPDLGSIFFSFFFLNWDNSFFN